MKIYAGMSEHYFSSGMYPFLFLNDEINVSLILNGNFTKDNNSNVTNLEQKSYNEYNFIGNITHILVNENNKLIFIVKTDKIVFFTFGENNSLSVNDYISGTGELMIDPGFYSFEEPNIFINLCVSEIMKITYQDKTQKYKFPKSELIKNNKAFIERVDNTMDGSFVDYILGLESEGLEKKVIPKTITD